MYGWCDLCGKQMMLDKKENSFINYALAINGYTKRKVVCKECAEELRPILEECLKRICQAEDKIIHRVIIKNHIDEMMWEEQELDAWKADIYGGDE